MVKLKYKYIRLLLFACNLKIIKHVKYQLFIKCQNLQNQKYPTQSKYRSNIAMQLLNQQKKITRTPAKYVNIQSLLSTDNNQTLTRN